VRITLAELCQQDNISLSPDVDLGLLSTYNVYPLVDAGAPPLWQPPEQIVEIAPSVWEVQYPPLSAQDEILANARILQTQYEAKVNKGVVLNFMGTDRWFPAGPVAMAYYRTLVDSDQINTVRLFDVTGGNTVTVNDANLSKSDQTMLLAAVAGYVVDTVSAMRDAMDDVKASNPADYDTFWASTTGSPLTIDDMTSGNGLEEAISISESG
jgi:hypothetical protein